MSAVGLLEVAQRVAVSGEIHRQRNVPATGQNVSGHIVDLAIHPVGGDAVAMTFVDVTHQRATEQSLRSVAERDQLTGLWNRSKFRNDLTHRLNGGQDVVVALMDLDGFKIVNDSLGHSVGDLLLQVIADRFSTFLPNEWSIARLGGDEFVIAVSAPREEAESIARRIVDVIGQPVQLNGARMTPSVSVGVATAPLDGDEVGELLRMADTALYGAKRTGSDYVICGDRERHDASHQAALFSGLDRAFDDNQFEMYAQPIVALGTGHIVGAEALVRWVLPGIGVKLPGDFLNLLSMSGRVGELTDRMISRALTLTGSGRFMSVNLAASDLYRPDLVHRVTEAARKNSEQGRGDLWLEVVESELQGAAGSTIDGLINNGIQLAIDDFGACHSSLARVIDHDIAVLKLDRELICNLPSSHRAQRLVRALVDATHDLGALVVAEGIEDADMQNIAADIGCDLAQGYFLGRPAPAALVANILQTRSAVTSHVWPEIDTIKDWERQAVELVAPDVPAAKNGQTSHSREQPRELATKG